MKYQRINDKPVHCVKTTIVYKDMHIHLETKIHLNLDIEFHHSFPFDERFNLLADTATFFMNNVKGSYAPLHDHITTCF